MKTLVRDNSHTHPKYFQGKSFPRKREKEFLGEEAKNKKDQK